MKTTLFKAADTKVALFISNVHKEVSEHDIIDYVSKNTGKAVSLVKIKMKKERDYNVFVTKYKIDVFLGDNLWLHGINRRFVYLKEKQEVKGDPGRVASELQLMDKNDSKLIYYNCISIKISIEGVRQLYRLVALGKANNILAKEAVSRLLTYKLNY